MNKNLTDEREVMSSVVSWLNLCGVGFLKLRRPRPGPLDRVSIHKVTARTEQTLVHLHLKVRVVLYCTAVMRKRTVLF